MFMPSNTVWSSSLIARPASSLVRNSAKAKVKLVLWMRLSERTVPQGFSKESSLFFSVFLGKLEMQTVGVASCTCTLGYIRSISIIQNFLIINLIIITGPTSMAPQPPPVPLPPSLQPPLYITALTTTICLGTFVSAYISVTLTQIAPVFQHLHQLSLGQLVWQLTIATSSFNFGSILGPLLYTRVSNPRWSIPKVMLVLDLLTILFTLAQCYRLQFVNLAVCRLFLGLLLGVTSALVPMAIRILAPEEIAGKLGTINQVMQTSGVLCACAVGFVGDWGWRLVLGAPVLAVGVRLVVLASGWGCDWGDEGQLRGFVRRVYVDEQLGYAVMRAHIDNQRTRSVSSVCSQSPSYPLRFRLGLLMMLSNQVTGINAIIFYLKQLISKVLPPSAMASNQIIMCVLAGTQVLSTLCATACVQKSGRRSLILTGQSLITLILLLIFLVDRMAPAQVSHTVTLALICVHIITHNLTLGPMAIVYCADILDNLSPMIVGIKVCSFLVALASEYMIEYLGVANMFAVYGGLSLLVHVGVRGWVLETRGLTKEQVIERYDEMVKGKAAEGKND